MAKNISEIAVDVLHKLGRLPAGQVALPGQIKIVKQAYVGLYDELFGDSLVNWAEDDDVPSFAVYPVTVLLTGMVASDFGVPDIWSGRAEGMRFRLSRSLQSPYVPQPTQFESF